MDDQDTIHIEQLDEKSLTVDGGSARRKWTRKALLGMPKDTATNDPRALEIIEHLRKQNFEAGWTYEQEVPAKISAVYQPVYDDEGRYFRVLDRLHNLVLIVKRPGWPSDMPLA